MVDLFTRNSGQQKSLIVVAAIAIIAIGISCIFYTSYHISNNNKSRNGIAQAALNSQQYAVAVNNASNFIDAQSQAFNSLFRQVEPSVVTIEYNPIINGSYSNVTFGGSGFVYRPDGYIITNAHVVSDAPKGLVDVTLYDGNSYTAIVRGVDIYDDIAVLQIVDDYSREHLVPLVLANSSQLEIGQVVIAVGSPGFFTETMTHGIISQLGRLSPDLFQSGFDIPDVIQTDTFINHGNSGGPLVNSRGLVVGMNSYGAVNLTGINFAIPSNLVARVAPEIIQTGKYDNPWLGFSGQSLTPSVAQILGLPRDHKGVGVYAVVPGGPMDKAGVLGYRSQSGNNAGSVDIISAIDGYQVKDLDALDAYVAEHTSVGQTITLTIDRNGHNMDLHLVIQARPPPPTLPLLGPP